MLNLDHCGQSFNRVGWFIPPYINVGFLDLLAREISNRGAAFDQNTLQNVLARIYSPLNLAAMVNQRYPITPFVQDYKRIIAEAIEAHFLGLDHAAVAALLPALEGAGRRLAVSRGLPVAGVSTMTLFADLAIDCKKESREKQIGAVDEIASMMDSFVEFTRQHLYIHSDRYGLDDKTNRHGILHGAYADADYGAPINFYKTVAGIDLLCFVAAFRSRLPCLAPHPTPSCHALAEYYGRCAELDGERPSLLNPPPGA
jgi:hypothetical protein